MKIDEPEKELGAAVGAFSSSMNQALDAFKGAIEKFETKISAQKIDGNPFGDHCSIQISIDREAGMYVATALPSNGVRKFKGIAPDPYLAGRKLFRSLEKERALER